jgi:phosphoribosylformylglycinamidine synthase
MGFTGCKYDAGNFLRLSVVAAPFPTGASRRAEAVPDGFVTGLCARVSPGIPVQSAFARENSKLETSNLNPETWGARMKAKIIITPKKAVVDPQGITVRKALEHMGYKDVAGVHIGKYIEIDLAPGTDKAAAQKALNDAAHKLLSNPVIEDFKLEIE